MKADGVIKNWPHLASKVAVGLASITFMDAAIAQYCCALSFLAEGMRADKSIPLLRRDASHAHHRELTSPHFSAATNDGSFRLSAGRRMNTNSAIVDREQCSEQSLVSAAMGGDLMAFSALCRLHSPRLFRSVRQITRNHEDAEDALQDAFMRASVHLKSFDGRAQFATWLTRIALNSALMILRKRKYYPAVSIDSDPQEDDRFFSLEIADRADDPERRLLKSETREWVRQAIAELDPLPRAAVEFRNFEGVVDQGRRPKTQYFESGV